MKLYVIALHNSKPGITDYYAKGEHYELRYFYSTYNSKSINESILGNIKCFLTHEAAEKAAVEHFGCADWEIVEI